MRLREHASWYMVPGLLLILLVLAKHLILTWLLLVNGNDVAGITSLRIPIMVFGGTTGAGLAYAAVSTAVGVSLHLGGHDKLHLWRGILHLSSAIAQQILLVISAAGSCLAIWNGMYLDGTRISGGRAHLTGDQDIYILLALFHPLAVLVLYAPSLVDQIWDKLWTLTNGSR